MNRTSPINTISLYEGSFQIKRIRTHFEITKQFIADELRKLGSHRKSDVGYWAEVEQDGALTHHTLAGVEKFKEFYA